MILLNLFIVVAMGITASLSTRYFSPDELIDRFETGQRLYALGDYAKAIGHYQATLATESNATIDVERVSVNVDEFILPVQVAAAYQLANSHNKLGLEKLERSEFLRKEQKEELAEERYQEALRDLDVSLQYFSQLAADETVGGRTRVLAQFQMLETAYQLKRYGQVVEEGEAFVRNFPNSVYESSIYYNMGWSSFKLERYPEAIEYYERVLFLSPRGSNSDRALLQIAECHDRMGRYDEAIASLDRLTGRYDFSQMSEQQLIEMASLKLKGLAKETTRELVANAQLKKGDIKAKLGKVEEALAIYAVVPEQYPSEARLVQNAYIRSAELIREDRGTQAAIAAYKNSIENVDDKLFQARAQLTVAALLFDEGTYMKAAEEYGIYLKAYGDVASRVGFAGDKVLFRMGQCYQAQGQTVRGEDPQEGLRLVGEAIHLYRQVIDEHGGSPIVADALFGLGFSEQLAGDAAAGRQAYQQLVERFPGHPVARRAWVQLARIEYEEGDSEAARDIYLSVLERYPETDQANSIHLELGITYTRLEDRKAAIDAFEAVEPSFGQWPKTQVELAQLYLLEGKVEESEAVLDRALIHEGGGELSGRLHHMKGRIRFDLDDYSSAVREFSLSLTHSADPSIHASSLFSRGAAHYELAKRQDASGDSSLARPSYQASLADMEELLQQDILPNMRDGAFRTLGAVMIRLNQQREAAQYYRELIAASSDPQEQATFRMLEMELYYDMGDLSQAERVARRLLELEFEDDNTAGYFRKERAYSIIGNALLQRKNHTEAAEVFARGLTHYPNSGESANMAFSKALAQFGGGDYERARQSFAAYLKAYPNDHNLIHGHYYLAHAHQVLTQFEEAAEEFAGLARRYPGSNYEEEALFLVGENHYNRADYTEAARAYPELLAKYPQGTYAAAATYALAWAYFEQEMEAEGVEAMRTLVERYPQSEFATKAQFTIGDFYYNTRSYGEALAAYQYLAEVYPDSEEAPRAQDLVSELDEIEATFEYARTMELFEAKKYEEAVAGFEEIAQKYAGTNTELAAYCNQGLSFEIMRRWKQAADSYEQVLEKGGDNTETADVVSFAKIHRDWIVENRL